MANPLAHNYVYPKRSPIPNTYGCSLRELAKLRRKCGTLEGALELARVKQNKDIDLQVLLKK